MLAAWFSAEMIKKEEGAKNKNYEVNDAQWELEEEDDPPMNEQGELEEASEFMSD